MLATLDFPQNALQHSARGRTDASQLMQQLPQLRQRLLRRARFAVGDDASAEDLVQETLLTIVQQSSTHRGEASLSTWAVAILKNKIADWYRSPARRRVEPPPAIVSTASANEAAFDDDGRYAEPVPAWQQPENRVEQRQMMTVLEECVRCLPARSGRVFMMREWLGFDTAEVCERLNLSAENCRTMLHRARTSLRACMQRHWMGPKVNA